MLDQGEETYVRSSAIGLVDFLGHVRPETDREWVALLRCSVSAMAEKDGETPAQAQQLAEDLWLNSGVGGEFEWASGWFVACHIRLWERCWSMNHPWHGGLFGVSST